MARIHVILDEEVLEAIDNNVGPRGRSRFLEEAAREKLERIELEEAIRTGAGLLKDKHYPHWRDTASVQEWVRASRRGTLTAEDIPRR
jgi:metal-responsive CopG/Arc/MetJ family transcriptional regulator